MSKSYTILRFEVYSIKDQQWKGIYSRSSRWYAKSHDIDHGCPGPTCDSDLIGILRRKTGCEQFRHLMFGFISKEQLRKWFWDEEINRIMSKSTRHLLGYCYGGDKPVDVFTPSLTLVHGVDCTDVYCSPYQVCYKPREYHEVTRLTSLRAVKKYLGIYNNPDHRVAEYY